MSTLSIRQGLEKHLKLLTPAVSIAYENVDFTRATGTPYQEVTLLPAQPDNSSAGPHHYIETGLMQVMLCYPLNAGPGTAAARAELTRNHFKRGTTIIEDGIKIIINKTPQISPAMTDSERYKIPISIYYQADIFI
jgi:hypothetical protein